MFYFFSSLPPNFHFTCWVSSSFSSICYQQVCLCSHTEAVKNYSRPKGLSKGINIACSWFPEQSCISFMLLLYHCKCSSLKMCWMYFLALSRSPTLFASWISSCIFKVATLYLSASGLSSERPLSPLALLRTPVIAFSPPNAGNLLYFNNLNTTSNLNSFLYNICRSRDSWPSFYHVNLLTVNLHFKYPV